MSFVNQGLGTAILVGREDRIRETAALAGIDLEGRDGIEIHNARAVAPQRGLCAVPLRAAAAEGLSCSATASA